MFQRFAAYVYLAGVALVVTLQRGAFARAVAHHEQAGDLSLLRKLVACVAGGFVVVIYLLREKRKRKASGHENAGGAVPRISAFDNLKRLYTSGGDGLGRHPIAGAVVSLLILGIPMALFFLTHPGGLKGIDAGGWTLLGVLELPGLLVLTVIVAGSYSHKQRAS